MAHKQLTGSGGKGSVSRVSDLKKYQDNYDRIFGEKHGVRKEAQKQTPKGNKER